MSKHDAGAQASALSEALAAGVERAGRSIVNIAGARRRGSSGVVWSEGVIVASDHTLDDTDSVELTLSDGREVTGTIAGRDGATDLAVLRAETTGIPAVTWSDTSALRVGHLAVSLSRPGKSVRAALAMVSALGDEWRTHGGGRIERYIQADVALRPGFSGGLLVNLSGHAIGLQSAGLIRNTAIAIPEPTVRRVTEAILARGRVERGFLGVGTCPVRLTGGLEEKAGQGSGLLVLSVHPESPADRAGVLIGDAIVALGGEPVMRPGDLLARLSEEKVGSPSRLRLIRAGELRDIDVTIGARGGA